MDPFLWSEMRKSFFTKSIPELKKLLLYVSAALLVRLGVASLTPVRKE